ncbi:MAG: ABC transporter permease, partial [Candidatus Peribacteraceae bacterium]|nr:ABC transporter permease [Candidatus Peribacteraceae bacterium]
MRTSDTLRLALRMFRTRPMRTSLTILGVSVGIATVFFLVCLGYGLQQTILNRIANAETLLTLDVSAGSEAVRLTPERIEELRAIEHVGDIARLASFSAQVSIGSITSDMEINAVDPVFFRLSGISAVAGELFDAADGTGAVLSSAAVKLFGLTPQEILQRAADYTLYLPEEAQDGKISIRESAHATMVAGVVEDEDTSRLLLPLSAVAAIPIDHFHQVKVKVESHAHMESVRNAIMAQGFVVA